MRGTYVTAVKALHIAGDMGKGDRISEQLYITNNRIAIHNLVPQLLVPVVGTLESEFIRESKVVIWGTIEFDEKNDPVAILNQQIYQANGFLQSLWLFVDNGIDTELGFLFYNVRGMPTASSSYLNFGITDAKGDRPETSMSREQLREIRKFHR
jgi:hypothetical protein